MLTAVLIVAILAASWFLLVSPKRSEAGDLRDQASKEQATNDALIQQLNVLKAQSLDLPKQKAQLAVFAKQIPNNPALPTLIRDLSAAGKKVGVQVLSMKPGTPAAAAVTVPIAPVTAATTTASGAATTSTTTTGGTSASASGASPTAVAPVAAPLYSLPLSLEITGNYFEVEQFINKLEGMQRKFLLTGFSLKPGGPAANAAAGSTGTTTTGTGVLSLSLIGQVFLSPNAESSTPAAAPVTAQAH